MPSSTTSGQNSLYLYIKDMTINRANALPSPYLSGLPSIYGVVGMAQHLVDRVLNGSGLRFDSVAVCFSQFSMSRSQQKYPCYSKRDIKKHQTLRLITHRESRFMASVIIRCLHSPNTSFEEVVKWLEEHQHLDGLYNLRFCGGQILYSMGKPHLFPLQAPDLSHLCQHLNGFAVADRIELCRTSRRTEEDSLDTLLRLIKDSKKSAHGWLVPLAVGYKPLGEPAHRKNTRWVLHHAFAEPVVGLGRLFTISSISHELGQTDHFFWKPAKLDFLVAGSI
ncbi:type I-F CRISPR-associated protein Csy2 [Endozoicomonas euniceicola]|uniref:Type I-F CRISPR-associated protein Csy2 n=1 Tax=Endozoicomonas euniceicola TaxID=1234143 RepID=A0ABY6GR12_9GAMM|nr:type I-F CRISPR-associated protein Csy2 [Endozoicomonas euniceicola]UYM15192.1 hypothetical protein NX720_20365 [Endozoicomonas euniceicola]